MRHIASAAEQAEKERRRTRFLTIIMLVLLIGSSAGYAFVFYQQGGTQASGTGGQNQGQGYVNATAFTFQGQQITVQNSQSAVSKIPVSINETIQDYAGKTLYIDANNDAILAELSGTIGRFAGKVQPACYGACARDVPELNCIGKNLIVWRENETNSVHQEGQCVFIDGDLSSVDAFVYSVFGMH